jgi:hypothetical protein
MRRPEPTIRELVKAAQSAGWRVEAGGKHIKIYVPGQARPICVPHTLKCAKLRDQAKACRMAGLDI